MRRITRSTMAAGAIAVGVLIAASACSSPDAARQDTSISLRVGSIPGEWNPFEGGGIGGEAGQAVYESLVDAEGSQHDPALLLPRLATEWSLTDDGLTLTMELRDDVVFHDGEPMTAEGVASYLTDLYASDLYIHKNAVNTYGTTVEATGEHSLEFRTTVPIRAEFWLTLGETPIISPAAAADPAVLADGPVGTGPYLLDEVIPDVSISFVRNADYWAPELYPYDELAMTVYDDDDVAAMNALKTGDLDAAFISQISFAGEAEGAGLATFTSAGPTTFFFFVDRDGLLEPAIGDQRVRQAINMAFDRDAINESLNFGLGEISSQAFPAPSLLNVPGGDDRYPYDPEGARALLAEAGYPDGFDVTIPVAPSVADYQPIVEQSLAEIGIRVNWEAVPEEDYVWLLKATDFPIVFFASASGPGLATVFIPNFWQIGDSPEFTEILDTFLSGSVAESEQALNEMGEFLLDQAWYVPIGNRPLLYVSQTDVRVDLSPVGRYAYLWQYQRAA